MRGIGRVWSRLLDVTGCLEQFPRGKDWGVNPRGSTCSPNKVMTLAKNTAKLSPLNC